MGIAIATYLLNYKGPVIIERMVHPLLSIQFSVHMGTQHLVDSCSQTVRLDKYYTYIILCRFQLKSIADQERIFFTASHNYGYTFCMINVHIEYLILYNEDHVYSIDTVKLVALSHLHVG